MAGLSLHGVTGASVEVRETESGARWLTLNIANRETDQPFEVTLFFDSTSAKEAVLSGLRAPQGGT